MLGRICLSLLFVCLVVNQILNWDATRQAFDASVSNWILYPGLPDQAQKVFNLLFSHSSLVLIVGTVFAGLGGLLVLLGIKVRLGAILLILFLIPMTLIMHPFWMNEGAAQQMQMEIFLKNISILGGLFVLASCGGGE